jgi:hypothetical protein
MQLFSTVCSFTFHLLTIPSPLKIITHILNIIYENKDICIVSDTMAHSGRGKMQIILSIFRRQKHLKALSMKVEFQYRILIRRKVSLDPKVELYHFRYGQRFLFEAEYPICFSLPRRMELDWSLQMGILLPQANKMIIFPGLCRQMRELLGAGGETFQICFLTLQTVAD